MNARVQRQTVQRAGAASAPASGKAPRLDALRGLVGYNIRRADVLMHQHFARSLAAQQIRPSDYSALTLIDSNPLITQAEIAAALLIARPNLVGLISRLERRSLLKREVYMQDRRNQVLSLTAKGRALLQRVACMVEEQDREITRCWSRTERRHVLALLQRLHSPRRRTA